VTFHPEAVINYPTPRPSHIQEPYKILISFSLSEKQIKNGKEEENSRTIAIGPKATVVRLIPRRCFPGYLSVHNILTLTRPGSAVIP
jgi:hypothetical protein